MSKYIHEDNVGEGLEVDSSSKLNVSIATQADIDNGTADGKLLPYDLLKDLLTKKHYINASTANVTVSPNRHKTIGTLHIDKKGSYRIYSDARLNPNTSTDSRPYFTVVLIREGVETALSATYNYSTTTKSFDTISRVVEYNLREGDTLEYRLNVQTVSASSSTTTYSQFKAVGDITLANW